MTARSEGESGSWDHSEADSVQGNPHQNLSQGLKDQRGLWRWRFDYSWGRQPYQLEQALGRLKQGLLQVMWRTKREQA